MTALTRDTFSETLRTKGMESFFEKYDTFPVQYNMIVEKETIDGAYEIKTSIVDAAIPQEREDGQTTHRANMGEGFPVMMRKRFIGDVLEITKGTKQDVAIDLVKRFSTRASRGAIMAKNTMVANLFNNGFYTAGKPCYNNTVPNAMSDTSGNLVYDGYPFFNLTGNKRSSKGGGTYYNGETGVTLTSTTLASAIASMTTRNNKAENDTDIDLIPDILVTGPGAIAQSAKVILESEWIPETGNNAINIMRQALKLVVLNGITDTDFWAIGCSKSGIWAYDGGDPVFDSWYDADKGIYFYKYELEFSCGVKNWRYWYGFNGTTA
jgi:hypothetical protein